MVLPFYAQLLILYLMLSKILVPFTCLWYKYLLYNTLDFTEFHFSNSYTNLIRLSTGFRQWEGCLQIYIIIFPRNKLKFSTYTIRMFCFSISLLWYQYYCFFIPLIKCIQKPSNSGSVILIELELISVFLIFKWLKWKYFISCQQDL